jgi:hypothetical protein
VPGEVERTSSISFRHFSVVYFYQNFYNRFVSPLKHENQGLTPEPESTVELERVISTAAFTPDQRIRYEYRNPREIVVAPIANGIVDLRYSAVARIRVVQTQGGIRKGN